MRWLARIERWTGGRGIPRLTAILVGLQSLGFVVSLVQPAAAGRMLLIPARVLEGEVWRLVTFLALPPSFHPIFALFALYLLYLMGTALEARWGDLRYTLFVGLAVLGTIAAAFVVPGGIATNAYVDTSVFLAFAVLYPDFELLLFFVLPVRVKWLALATWAFYAYRLVTGGAMTRALIAASVATLALFFARDLWDRARSAQRRYTRRRAERRGQARPFHTCAACGATDRTHPEREFRYCAECPGGAGYCSACLPTHQHRAPANSARGT